ncbi:hypothetical protein [Streptomyces sp. KR2]|uniref:hypothetical protein n=1 Tax=Streptomyces sp. KR2 TaxID=1514824 RepID=UPI0036590B9A
MDDRFPSHRKVALLGDRAFRLHVSAICWCAENLTDGRISDRELPLVAKVRGVKATAQALVDAGLWDRLGDGWQIHDYLDYNPSREQVLAERKKNAERQERFRRRKNGKPTAPSGGDGNGGSNGVTPKAPQGSESQDGDATATRARRDGDTTAPRKSSVPDEEPQVNEFRNGVTNGAPTRPDPNPIDVADVDGGSTGSRTRAEQQPEGCPAPIDDDGFALTDAMRRWAAATFPSLDVEYETDQFISHFRGEGTRRRSWPDEWQKWMRRSAKYASERRQRQPSNVIALPGQTVPGSQPLTGTDARVAGWLALADQLQEGGPA